MEIEEVRHKLKQLRAMKFAIDNLKSRLKEMGENQKVISSYSERVQSSPLGDSLVNSAIQLLEYKDKVSAKIIDYYQKVNEIESLVEHCRNDLKREVVRAYYIESKSINSIAKRLERSPGHIKRLLRGGVLEIAKNAPL